MTKVILLLSLILIASSSAFPKDRIQDFFEWGEYDSLITSISEYLAQRQDSGKTEKICTYYSYRGVAYFAKGRIALALSEFVKAISCNPDLVLDGNYVAPEMLGLFQDLKNEHAQQLLLAHREDSLKAIFENQKRDRAKRKEQELLLRNRVWKNTGLSSASLAIGLFSGIMAAYEYQSGKQYEQKFDHAAQIGDLATYTQMKPILKQKNQLITGYSIVAAVAGVSFAWFAYQGLLTQHLRTQLTSNGNDYGLLFVYSF